MTPATANKLTRKGCFHFHIPTFQRYQDVYYEIAQQDSGDFGCNCNIGNWQNCTYNPYSGSGDTWGGFSLQLNSLDPVCPLRILCKRGPKVSGKTGRGRKAARGRSMADNVRRDFSRRDCQLTALALLFVLWRLWVY